MKIRILKYDKDRNECLCAHDSGHVQIIDPFVGCAIPLTDDEYQQGRGADIVGRSYNIPDDVLISSTGVILPGEGLMVEVTP